ncbi:carbohydrate ABC transporter permease [Paenibacillus cymbidii]|uniref:carbohydrate ABC transporter permease n=1 Tax=Paenibacillus cymbidii TaxID=1639034 RepID=UPI001081D012|nr:carbohydrate ABC transporter permease [Paenibacillus cymbidii]
MRQSFGEKAFGVFNYGFLAALSLLFVLPFLIVAATSLVGEDELIRRGSFILFPHRLDGAAYRTLLDGGSALYRAYGITLLRVTIGTMLNLLFTAMMAYGLSRKSLPGRGTFISLVFATMLFGGGLVPTFLLLKSLYLVNTFWVMIVPSLISAWNLLIMKSFFAQIPESLEEAATIDGATPLQLLIRIVVPLSKPTMATIGLFYAVWHWNAWFDAAIFINNLDLMPVQVLMRRVVLSMTSSDMNAELMADLLHRPSPQSLRGAMIIVTTLPILFVYPFLQKHFVKGVLIGSIKG